MNRVIHDFRDLYDGEHQYRTGDTFPRDGLEVTDARIKELSGSDNAAGFPVIAPERAAEPRNEEEQDKPTETAKKADRGHKKATK